ncbi:MAG: hypothetical protein OEW05_07690, partial [Candidatus Aminicenantes bacterium]|nr:hypothetical protein [Candidatus Aminicenantes bacterium]
MTSSSSPANHSPRGEAVRSVVLAALFFAISELAVALSHRVLIPRTTWLILFGLEFGLALAVSGAALVAATALAFLLRRRLDGAGFSALQTAGSLVAMPLFYSFYILNTKGLALLPFTGFQRLFFNGLFGLLAAAALAVATASMKRLSGRAAGPSFWAGVFLLQLILPAVHYFFFSSVSNPRTPPRRLVFLLALTVPLVAVAWLVARVGTGFKRRGTPALAAGGLVLVPLLLLVFIPPLSNYRRQPPSAR